MSVERRIVPVIPACAGRVWPKTVHSEGTQSPNKSVRLVALVLYVAMVPPLVRYVIKGFITCYYSATSLLDVPFWLLSVVMSLGRCIVNQMPYGIWPCLLMMWVYEVLMVALQLYGGMHFVGSSWLTLPSACNSGTLLTAGPLGWFVERLFKFLKLLQELMVNLPIHVPRFRDYADSIPVYNEFGEVHAFEYAWTILHICMPAECLEATKQFICYTALYPEAVRHILHSSMQATCDDKAVANEHVTAEQLQALVQAFYGQWKCFLQGVGSDEYVSLEGLSDTNFLCSLDTTTVPKVYTVCTGLLELLRNEPNGGQDLVKCCVCPHKALSIDTNFSALLSSEAHLAYTFLRHFKVQVAKATFHASMWCGLTIAAIAVIVTVVLFGMTISKRLMCAEALQGYSVLMSSNECGKIAWNNILDWMLDALSEAGGHNAEKSAFMGNTYSDKETRDMLHEWVDLISAYYTVYLVVMTACFIVVNFHFRC